MDKPLSPEMVKALGAIRANGGRVGNWLNAYKAIGTNGRAMNGLERRGLVVRRVVDGSTYMVLSD